MLATQVSSRLVGHKYCILSDDITDEEAKELSDSQNADQNQNAGNGDGQNIRKVLAIYNTLQKQSGPHVPVGIVISKYAAQSIVKVNPNNVGAWDKYVSGQGAGEYVTEFLDWLPRYVNSADLSCPPSWLEELIKDIPKEYVITKLAITYIQYSGDGKTVNQRPVPDTAKFVSGPELIALGKNKEVLHMMEDFFRHNRLHIETEMQRRLGYCKARDLLRSLEINVARLALSKSLTKDFLTKAIGKISQDKIEQMRTDWLKYCVKQPGNQALADLPARIGIPITDEVENTKEEQCQALQFFRRPIRPRPYKLYSFTYMASLSHAILHPTYIPSFAVNARVACSPTKMMCLCPALFATPTLRF